MNFDKLTQLDDRQEKEVLLSLLYATQFAHGTGGHNAYMTIARLASKAGYYYEMDQGKPILHRRTDIISDGYHTFYELYDHRCRLFAWLMNLKSERAFKTRKHDDGSEHPGWFVGVIVSDYGDISYHLPMELWELVKVPEIERYSTFDGHDSDEVLERLSLVLAGTR